MKFQLSTARSLKTSVKQRKQSTELEYSSTTRMAWHEEIRTEEMAIWLCMAKTMAMIWYMTANKEIILNLCINLCINIMLTTVIFVGEFINVANAQRMEKKCNYCMRLNNFESVCQQKLKSDHPIRQIMQADEREQSESVNTVTSQICNEWFVSKVSDSNLFTDTNTWNNTVKVEDVEIPVKVDSGADVSIINIEEFKRLKNPPKLIRRKIKYKAYNQTDIKVHGKCLLQIETQNGT